MITVSNLKKDFNGFQALKGIYLNVHKGEIYGFIGHNGAGKSTTMYILTGLSRPSSGDCIVNGKNLRDIRHPSELDIGYLPEEPKFYPWMTAFETLDYLGKSSDNRVSVKRLKYILEWVDLKDAANRRVGGFSRGMRQRLGIASALIHDPKLLFFDEPSSALDPEGRSDVLKLIKELKEMGKTIFFSTHILDDVERVCDRVGMIEKGRIILEKPLEKLLGENISPIFDVVLMKEANILKGQLQSMEGVSSVVIDGEKIAVSVINAEKASGTLLAFFANSGIPVQSFAQRKKSLEDIYIKEVSHS